MASNGQFILLIFGVKLDEVRAAMADIPVGPHSSATDGTTNGSRSDGVLGCKNGMNVHGKASHTPSVDNKTAAANSRSLIDFANYMAIPHSFVSSESHPKRTNLLCWHCGLPFNRTPRFIALDSARTVSSDVKADRTYEWIIDGNFCSWACAAAHIDDHYQEPKKWSLNQNLSVVRAQADGVKIRPVKRAPDRIKMRSYSGAPGMSQQEYADRVELLSQQ